VRVVLSIPAVRIVLGASMVAQFVFWMGEVAMTWSMASLGVSPLWVALMQTATSLPFFLLGLPSGAVADMMDKRRLLLLTQLWIASVAALLAITVVGGLMNPHLLLALAFVNGCGIAMRLPLVASLLPQLVSREQLPDALAFNAVAYNMARIFGPILAGVLISFGGVVWVFWSMAALALLSVWPVWRWRWRAKVQVARTPLGPAIREGLSFVWGSPPVRLLLLRISLFFFHACALLALLPLLVREMPDAGAAHYTLLLSCMGVGGVLGATVLAPRARGRVSTNVLVTSSILLLSASMLLVAWSTRLWVVAPAMLVAGLGWLAAGNSLTIATQVALPDRLRARGMAIYQSALMGGTALGAACWGKLAEFIGVPGSVTIAAVSGSAVALMLARAAARKPNPQE